MALNMNWKVLKGSVKAPLLREEREEPRGRISAELEARFLALPLATEVENSRIARILKADQTKRAKMIKKSTLEFTVDKNDPYRVERSVLACFQAAGQKVPVHPFVTQPGTQDWLPGTETGAPPKELEKMCEEAAISVSYHAAESTSPKGNSKHDAVALASALRPAATGRNLAPEERRKWDLNFGTDPPYLEKEGFKLGTTGIISVPYPLHVLPTEITPSRLDIDEEQLMPGYWPAYDDEFNRWCVVRKYNIMEEEDRALMVDELLAMHECPSGDPRTSPLPLMYGAYLRRIQVHVVFEWPEHSNASRILHKRGPAPESIVSAILRIALVALHKLHSAGRVHNALVLSNVWFFATGQVKLAGLEYSTYIERQKADISRRNKYRGPTQVMAPERLLGLESSPGSDIWSVGLFAINMATGEFPYNMSQFKSLQEFKYRVVHGPLPQLPQDHKFSSKLVDFIMSCIKKNPQYRHPIPSLLSHPFIRLHENVGRREIRQYLMGLLDGQS